MRPSTVLILFVALVVGLGATAAARSAGLFKRPDPPAPPEPPTVTVVVAARNLFADTALDLKAVKTRTLRGDELKDYLARRDQYITAPEVVALRVAANHVEADRPVLRSDLKPLARPESVTARLTPQARSVTVAVPKDRAAAGLIQVGEWVDVLLTTSYAAPGGPAGTQTVPLATAARVVAKRDTLWALPGSLPDGTPVRFTLEVNPYRAALIEYARNKGALTLVPRAKPDEPTLPVGLTPDPPATGKPTEDDRAAAAGRGEGAVGDADLMRLLGLKPPPPPAVIDLIVGAERKTVSFPAEGGGPAGYTFAPPAEPKPAESDKPKKD